MSTVQLCCGVASPVASLFELHEKETCKHCVVILFAIGPCKYAKVGGTYTIGAICWKGYGYMFFP